MYEIEVELLKDIVLALWTIQWLIAGLIITVMIGVSYIGHQIRWRK